NPNDLAFYLLYGMCLTPLLLYVRSFFARFLCLGIVVVSVMEIMRTGSRAAFVSLAALGLVIRILSSRRIHLALLAAGPVVAVLLSLIIPHSTWTRISEIVVHPEAEYATTTDENLRRALESQMARMNLQKRAIKLTLQHPLLGVGPQMFADAADLL